MEKKNGFSTISAEDLIQLEIGHIESQIKELEANKKSLENDLENLILWDSHRGE